MQRVFRLDNGRKFDQRSLVWIPGANPNSEGRLYLYQLLPIMHGLKLAINQDPCQLVALDTGLGKTPVAVMLLLVLNIQMLWGPEGNDKENLSCFKPEEPPLSGDDLENTSPGAKGAAYKALVELNNGNAPAFRSGLSMITILPKLTRQCVQAVEDIILCETLDASGKGTGVPNPMRPIVIINGIDWPRARKNKLVEPDSIAGCFHIDGNVPVSAIKPRAKEHVLLQYVDKTTAQRWLHPETETIPAREFIKDPKNGKAPP